MGNPIKKGEPKWKSKAASYDKYYKLNANAMTIIGNIHQPELKEATNDNLPS